MKSRSYFYKKCKCCQKEMQMRKSELAKKTFCSKVCKYNYSIIHCVCKICGISFTQSKYEVKKRGSGKFCSPQCSGIAQQKRRVSKCTLCKKEFLVKKSWYKKGRGKFCSKKCMNKNRENKITCTCLNCKNKFQRIPSLTFRDNCSNRHCFCGTKCYLEYRGRTSIEKTIMKSLKFLSCHFKEQKPLSFREGRTFVDFFLQPNICLYVDGDYWHSFPSAKKRDKRNNLSLKKLGYNVIRIKESTIKKGKSFYMPILKNIKRIQEAQGVKRR